MQEILFCERVFVLQVTKHEKIRIFSIELVITYTSVNIPSKKLGREIERKVSKEHFN